MEKIAVTKNNNRYFFIVVGLLLFLTMMNRLISSSYSIVLLLMIVTIASVPLVLGNATKNNVVIFFWFVFLLYIVFRSYSFSQSAIKSYLIYFSGLMLLIFIYHSGNIHRLNRNAYLFIMFLIVITSFSIIIQFVFPSFPLVAKDGDELGGITGRTYYVVLCSFLIISVCMFLKKKKLIWKILLILLAAVSVLISGSRSNILTIPFSIILTYLLSAKKGRRFVQLFKIVLIASILLIVIFYIGKALQLRTFTRIEESILRYSKGQSFLSGRDVLVERAIAEFRSNPAFGIGWFGISEKYSTNGAVGSHVHNLYLQLLSETGIVGFVLFLLPSLIVLLKSTRFLLKRSESFSQLDKGLYLVCYSYQIYYLASSFLHATSFDSVYMILYFASVGFLLKASKAKKI